MGSRDSRRIAGLEMKVAAAARSEAVGAESEMGETMGGPADGGIGVGILSS